MQRRRKEELISHSLSICFVRSLSAVPVLFPFCSRSVPATSNPKRERLNLALVLLAA